MNPLKYVLLPLGLVSRLLSFIFGKVAWSPPIWLAAIAGRVARSAAALKTARQAHPGKFWIKSCSALLLVAAASYGGYYWYTLPEPFKLTVSGTWPPATRLEKDAKPVPLVIRFSGSAAALDKVGKVVTSGIAIIPALEGEWKWSSDSELVLTPKADWEVGQKYRVTFAPEFLAKHVLLADYNYDFETAKFKADLNSLIFYDDPTDPANKKVVATLKFSHPVDKLSLEREIALKIREEPNKSFDSSQAKKLQFKVSYREDGGEAYVHSEQIKIPDQPGEVLLSVGNGVRAQRQGPPLEQPLSKTVAVPSVDNYFRIEAIAGSVVTNKDDEPEHVFTVQSTVGVSEHSLKESLELYLLPKDKPAIGVEPIKLDYAWSDPNEVVSEVLLQSSKLSGEVLPSEQEFSKVLGVRYSADVGRYIYVKARRGMKSYGGFALTRDFGAVFRVAEFPRELKIMHDGSLLTLSGARKLSVMARNLEAVQFSLHRLLPDTIHHLVAQSGGIFQRPSFDNYNFDIENIADLDERVEALPKSAAGKAQYTVYDFSKMIRSDGAAPRGLFLLKVAGYDPLRKETIGVQDERLILLTDLGILAKDARDGSHDIFVQSLQDGTPISGATVQVLGKNGVAVLGASTDGQGHVAFPSFNDFKREKTPVAYLVGLGSDSSFLPLNRYDREVNLSRFDSGGLRAESGEENLQAYLFSDRGIYRPGEDVSLAILLRDNQWRPLPEGLPLELTITDARGLEVKRENLSFDPIGFKETSFATREASPIGTYHAELTLVRDTYRRTLLGSTSFRVEEFLPDRMTLKAQLDPAPGDGWISPDGLKLNLSLRNLFGIPAANRKVKAALRLAPAFPSFAKFKDYYFADPLKSKNSFEDNLGEKETDEQGTASFELNLNRFEKGLYRLSVLSEGFEAEGGRSVRADASAIVSSLPYLIGYKLDGATDFLQKNSERNVSLIAVSPSLEPFDPKDLSMEIVETRYVSALTKQDSGILAYQSVKREIIKSKGVLPVRNGAAQLKLDTSVPGNLSLVLRNGDGLELNRVNYTVVGDANLSSSLEKNAELQLKLNKSDYAPGEEIEVQVQAPYGGAGLISIEQEKVHAFNWFKSDTTSSVQKIKVPESLEGNGYLTVSFVRSLDSKEIFTSPVSHGTVPFSVSRARHTNPIALALPHKVKPGELLRIGYTLDAQSFKDSRMVIAAVDEGILQVAKYKTPDPLAHFFRKRALEVSTFQILDLLLPEYDIVRELSAAGGDEDAFLARNLNPFKRRAQKAVAYWSGIFTPQEANGFVEYRVPEYFNGTLRVYALSVSSSAIGVSEAKALSQGDFVIAPNVPLFAAPGDTFEVTASVANNVSGSGELPLDVTLKVGAAFTLESEPKLSVKVKESAEASVAFKLKTNEVLGDTELEFAASSGAHSAKLASTLSVRPALPLRSEVTTGVVAPGILSKNANLKLTRTLFPEFRELDTGVSHSPLILAYGLSKYLKNYPHGCTEQLISQAFPQMILAGYPELGLKREEVDLHLQRTYAILYGRQNADGGFTLWGGPGDSLYFESAYVTHFLIEAKERGYNPPENMLQRAILFQRNLPDQEIEGLAGARSKAYAIYLLTRNGEVTTNRITTLRESLDAEFGAEWRRDLLALYLGASYRLLRLDQQADELAAQVSISNLPQPDYENYYDPLSFSGQYLALLARHYPKRAAKEASDVVLKISDELSLDRFNTISSAFTILAFEQYSKDRSIAPSSDLKVEQVLADGKRTELPLPQTTLAALEYDEKATELKFTNSGSLPIFFFASASGFDRELPKSELKQKLEVYREFRNAAGEVVTSAKRGDDLTVKILVRTVSDNSDFYLPDLAVVDLLPGGFEVDASARELLANSGGESDEYWSPVSADVREDRVILFGSADPTILRFSYKAKATAKGSFVIPALYAYSMYDRSVHSLTTGGKFEVQ